MFASIRKLVITFLVLSVMAGLLGATSYASFTAKTTNPTNVLAGATMTMTDVAGTAVSGTNCTTSVNNGTCATLFNASTTGFIPGGTDKTNSATITYTGSVTTGSFGMYTTAYTSKTGSSSSLCTATNPASLLDFQVKQGTTIVYPTSGSGYGTLDGFATAYTGTGAFLHLKNGANGAGTLDQWATNDSAVFTINIHLDTTADNTYQGCQSQVDFVWYASQ